ncbi:hypothetical protein PFISCL1PPCAC_17965, partial [Pristionchus fissidentatus]
AVDQSDLIIYKMCLVFDGSYKGVTIESLNIYDWRLEGDSDVAYAESFQQWMITVQQRRSFRRLLVEQLRIDCYRQPVDGSLLERISSSKAQFDFEKIDLRFYDLNQPSVMDFARQSNKRWHR